MAPSFGRLRMATNTSSSAYKPLHEYQILRVSNFPHLCELYTTLSVVVQHIPICTVLSFTKRPACLEHHQVWLLTLSRSTNSVITTFVRSLYILSSLLVLMVPLKQKVGHSSKCQSWMPAPLSDFFPYISMSISPKRSHIPPSMQPN
ncbi:hypothetical protein BHE74_00024259 [Ensete ventricosum]|nr:hypothetical protein GW17_00014979 [Ensete ventricosum]RWW68234.1 hypothetical protein BHE74_00024259 [Ensete ventricosum]